MRMVFFFFFTIRCTFAFPSNGKKEKESEGPTGMESHHVDLGVGGVPSSSAQGIYLPVLVIG